MWWHLPLELQFYSVCAEEEIHYIPQVCMIPSKNLICYFKKESRLTCWYSVALRSPQPRQDPSHTDHHQPIIISRVIRP